MAYDNNRNALVLFGGYVNPGVNGYFADTWEGTGSGSATGADLWMKDTMTPDLPEDLGTEPTVSSTLFISRDIWVRDNPDTIATSANPGPDTTSPSDRYYTNEHLHQDPTYVNATTPSYVYVKVRNRGCAASSGTEKLRVYWVDAATGSPWPSSWNEIDSVPGGVVDPVSLPVIAPGQDYVAQLSWVPPDPFAFGDHHHFCLLARIETTLTFPFGMTSSETPFLAQNVAENNNIVWKNLTVFTGASGIGRVIVRNTFRRKAALDLHFAVPAAELKNHFLLHGDIFLNIGAALMEKWRRGGLKARGFIVMDDKTIKITDPQDAVLGGLLFGPGEEQTIEVRMQLRPNDKTRPGTSFNWDVIQMAPLKENARPSAIGGERYTLTIPQR
jgi:hypothetical protein